MTIVRVDAPDFVLEFPCFETGAANHSLSAKRNVRQDCAVPDTAVHEFVDLCFGATEFFGDVLSREDFAHGRRTRERLWLSRPGQAFPEYLGRPADRLLDSVMS